MSDLATAHLTALDHLTGGGGSNAFNAGTGRGNTVIEVLPAVEGVTQKRVTCGVPRSPSGTAELTEVNENTFQTAGRNLRVES